MPDSTVIIISAAVTLKKLHLDYHRYLSTSLSDPGKDNSYEEECTEPRFINESRFRINVIDFTTEWPQNCRQGFLCQTY